MIGFSPQALDALLVGAGWSGYRAAQLIGVDESTIQRARAGQQNLSEPAWGFLLILALQEERDQLPVPPLVRLDLEP